MIKIELPDGSIKEAEAGISGLSLANEISHNLEISLPRSQPIAK